MKKLVRDNISDFIRDQGKQPITKVLDDDAYLVALKNKFEEEVQELIEAQSKDEHMNELADLQELIDALAKFLNILPSELSSKKTKKKKRNGGFDNRIFLEEVV